MIFILRIKTDPDLAFVFFTMWGIAFVLFERDLTSPAMLLISGYTICAGVAAVSWLSYPFAFHR